MGIRRQWMAAVEWWCKKMRITRKLNKYQTMNGHIDRNVECQTMSWPRCVRGRKIGIKVISEQNAHVLSFHVLVRVCVRASACMCPHIFLFYSRFPWRSRIRALACIFIAVEAKVLALGRFAGWIGTRALSRWRLTRANGHALAFESEA